MPQSHFTTVHRPGIHIALSTVKDGSMLNRENYDDAEVQAHRATFFTNHGLQQEQAVAVNVQYSDELSYKNYRGVTIADQNGGMDYHTVPIADALVTTEPGVVLFLPLADCVGVVLYDPIHRVVMLSHLGRHSLEVQSGMESVRYLEQQYETDPSTLQVWLTPAPSKTSYSIWKLNGQGMKEATFSQLLSAGVNADNITDHPSETDHDEQFYSHSEFLAGRRSDDGRYAIIAWLPDDDTEQ